MLAQRLPRELELDQMSQEGSEARAGEGASAAYRDALLQAKRDIVLSAMQSASGDYNQAAKRLGIHANNLHRLIRDLNLKPRLVEIGRSSAARSYPEQ